MLRPVTLREVSVLHVRFLRAGILRGDRTPEAAVRRRVKAAGKKLLRQGTGRVILPAGISAGDLPEGLCPVGTLPLRRAIAADWCGQLLRLRGKNPAGARVLVTANALSGEVVRTVTELALGNRYVLLDVPYGGDTLANQLRREYGVSLLLSPTRQQMEEADVLVLFAARTDLRRRDPAVLRLYDEAAPLPPLLLPPVLEGQMPPGLCRPQLLAVLVESGVLRPGQITVGTAES